MYEQDNASEMYLERRCYTTDRNDNGVGKTGLLQLGFLQHTLWT